MLITSARRGISVLLAICVVLVGSPFVGTAPVAAVPVDDGTVTSDLNCVTFVDASTGYAAGASGVILKTTNAGASWRTVRTGGAYDFRGISFADASTGWAITLAGQVFKTTNGGVDWNLVSADVGGPFYVLESFYDIDFWNADSGFAGGGRLDGPPMIARGDSGGSAWGPLPAQLGSYDPPETEPPFPRDGLGYFYGLDARSSAKAWACGQDVFKTPTLSVIWAWDGAQWTQQPVSGTGRLLDIAFGTDTAGVAVGDGGMVRYTTNGGATWSSTTPAVSTELDGVDLLPAGQGWMVGQSGEIWRTSTFGSAWTKQTSGTFAHLLDVAVLSSTSAVAVGRGGTILRTTDGVTWKAPAAAPVVSVLDSSSHPAGEWVSDASVDLSWLASGDIDGYGFVFDQSESTNPAVVNTALTHATDSAPASGVWYAHVAAHDTLGRWSPPKHRQVLVDTTDPSISDDADPAGYTAGGTVNLLASDAHSGVASISYSINGAPSVLVQGSVAQVPFTAVGEFVLTYTAEDNAGNVSTLGSATFTVHPPTAAPVITALSSTSHTAGQWNDSLEVSLQWSASVATALEYGVVFDGNPWTVVDAANAPVTTSNTSTVETADGSGTWYAHVAARDTFGEWGPTRHLQVLVDVTTPLVSDDADPAGYTGSATVNLSAADADSGVSRIVYEIDGTAAAPVLGTVASVVFNSAGTYVVTYLAYDLADNVSLQGTATVKVLPAPPAPAQQVAISGADRYLTAIESCNKTFGTGVMPTGPDGRRTVVIASGENWPDALSAAGLAGAYEAPLLLTRKDSLPSSVGARLASLQADKVFIVGGAAAVTDAVKNSIDAIVPGSSVAVERISGVTRYETASSVAMKTLSAPGRMAWDGTAFVATGGNFPDALAAGPLAAAKGLPMYLARPAGITDATLDAMVAHNVTRVYVLGGTAAVSPATVSALNSRGIVLAGRWAGTTRYATAAAVAENSLLLGLDAARPALATGTNYPDALAGGVMQGAAGSVVVLTSGTSLSPEAADVLSAHRADVREVRFLGGTAALSLKVRSDAMFAVNAP